MNNYNEQIGGEGKHTNNMTSPKMKQKLKDIGRPEYGKQYSLTGKISIANGNTWKESEIKIT